MKACYIRCSITYNQINFLSFENIKNSLSCLFCCNIPHHNTNSWNRSNILQINTGNSNIIRIISLLVIFIQSLTQNLRPTSWSWAQIHCSFTSFENIELFIYLPKFKSRSSSKSLFLCHSVVLIILTVYKPFEKLLFICLLPIDSMS